MLCVVINLSRMLRCESRETRKREKIIVALSGVLIDELLLADSLTSDSKRPFVCLVTPKNTQSRQKHTAKGFGTYLSSSSSPSNCAKKV